MQTIVVIGTRPEAIKLLPLVIEMRRRGMDTFVLSTNQSSDLLPAAFALYGMQPDAVLPPPRKRKSLPSLVALLTAEVGKCLQRHKPYSVIVQGDTATAFAAANAAFLLQIPLIHVEAGMRTGNMASPFPEEVFRRAVDRLASLCFCPSKYQRRNLIKEGIPKGRIYVTGNTVLDSLRRFAQPMLTAPKTVLLTLHRRENAGKLSPLLSMLDGVAKSRPDLRFLIPIHPARKDEIAGESFKHLELISPIPPREFYALYAEFRLILTDSGGVEEEAAALGIPLLVLRETTERTEELKARRLRLVGTNPERVRREILRELSKPPKRKRTEITLRPSEKIADILKKNQKI